MVEYLDITQGITLDSETPLTHILWADDLVLFSTTSEGLQKQLWKQVEIVEQYKYVGCVFSSRGNVFSAHVKYTHDKARKAMFPCINTGTT